MGGERFTTEVWLKDPAEAFQQAKEQALYDYGHRGYTGTIAEKPGYVIRKQVPMTRIEAEAFIYGGCMGRVEIPGDMDSNDKWGEAYAVPLCKDAGGPTEGWLF